MTDLRIRISENNRNNLTVDYAGNPLVNSKTNTERDNRNLNRRERDEVKEGRLRHDMSMEDPYQQRNMVQRGNRIGNINGKEGRNSNTNRYPLEHSIDQGRFGKSQ